MTYGDRLKKIRKYLRMTQRELAQSLGINSKQTISDVENGKQQKITSESELILFDKFGINHKYLLQGGEMLKTDTPTQDIVSDVPLAYSSSGGDALVNIPYHASVYASAGGGSDATSMESTSPVTFSRGFLNSFLGIYNVNGLSIINAAGDSMSPTIKSGELMFVYPMENEGFKDGGIYVVMCGDALLVKRVWMNPITQEYTLKSDSVEVAPIVMKLDEASGCRFVGRVVGHLDRV